MKNVVIYTVLFCVFNHNKYIPNSQIGKYFIGITRCARFKNEIIMYLFLLQYASNDKILSQNRRACIINWRQPDDEKINNTILFKRSSPFLKSVQCSGCIYSRKTKTVLNIAVVIRDKQKPFTQSGTKCMEKYISLLNYVFIIYKYNRDIFFYLCSHFCL